MVVAFVNGDSQQSAGLVKKIDDLNKKHAGDGLKTFVVFAGGPELQGSIAGLAEKCGTSIPLTLLPAGVQAEDYQRYKIHPDTKNTVIVYRRKKVIGNFVDVTPETFEKVEKCAAVAIKQ